MYSPRCTELLRSAEGSMSGKIEPKDRETAGFAYVALRCNSFVRPCKYVYARAYIPDKIEGVGRRSASHTERNSARSLTGSFSDERI